MELGVIVTLAEDGLSGDIAARDGERYRFKYANGENMMFNADSRLPQFSGRHDQPAGFLLKRPRIGDPVVFSREEFSVYVVAWGYARHFVDLVERRYGTDFAEARPR